MAAFPLSTPLSKKAAENLVGNSRAIKATNMQKYLKHRNPKERTQKSFMHETATIPELECGSGQPKWREVLWNILPQAKIVLDESRNKKLSAYFLESSDTDLT